MERVGHARRRKWLDRSASLDGHWVLILEFKPIIYFAWPGTMMAWPHPACGVGPGRIVYGLETPPLTLSFSWETLVPAETIVKSLPGYRSAERYKEETGREGGKVDGALTRRTGQ